MTGDCVRTARCLIVGRARPQTARINPLTSPSDNKQQLPIQHHPQLTAFLLTLYTGWLGSVTVKCRAYSRQVVALTPGWIALKWFPLGLCWQVNHLGI